MKKFIVIALILMLSATAMFSIGGCSKREETLVVCNWADYIDESVITEFEQYYLEKTGKKIKVDYRTEDTNELMIQKLLEGNTDYDVMCPSDYAIEKLTASNSLQEITRANITNYANIDTSTLGLAFDEKINILFLICGEL
jgi:spermidine/putrescine transport system substrate-binding protein